MKLVFSFYVFFVGLSYSNCHLDKNYQFVSLSSPITSILNELELLDDSALKYISSYHPVKVEDRRKLKGGVFLSDKKLKALKKGIVFFDESASLKKIIDKNKIKNFQVKTQKKNPFELVRESIVILKPYLVSCEDSLDTMQMNLHESEEKLKKQLSKSTRKMIFFLGGINLKTLPDLVIANDGVMKFFKENSAINIYPSSLTYVPWSQKILNKLPRDVIYVGLQEGQIQRVDKIEANRMNITFPGVLSPGWFQIDFLIYFMNNFQ